MNEFHFYTKLDQTILLGVKATTVDGLLEGIRNVPDGSIYYHTHRFLQQHHYLSPEPPNDFAYWVTEVLGDASLGEQLSSVDIVQFRNIAELRNKFVEILSEYVRMTHRRIDCQDGEDFHFMSSRVFVFPTPHVAHKLAEFREILGKISINSFYYHVFDAKLRLEQGENDLSQWLRDMGKEELAEEVKRVDPYRHTLEGLRKRIMVLVKNHDQY